MAIVRITEIPQNRRDALVELEMEVRGFRGATAIIARSFRPGDDATMKRDVMRLWAKTGKAGGFAYRNGKPEYVDSWFLFEYIECRGWGGLTKRFEEHVRRTLHADGFHQYCNQTGMDVE